MGVLTILALILSLVSIANANIVEEFAATRDLDAFCSSYLAKYGKECSPTITVEQEERLWKLSKGTDTDAVINYITDVILKRDPELDMDEAECNEFKDDIADAASREIPLIIHDMLAQRNYQLDAPHIRSERTMNNRAAKVRSYTSCNLYPYAIVYGKVSKSWIGYIPKSVRSVKIPDVPNSPVDIYAVMQSIYEYVRAPDEIEKISKEVEMEKQRRAKIQEEHQKTLNLINEQERLCYMDENQRACQRLDRVVDEFILKHLGSEAIRIVKKNDNFREPLYYAARLAARYRDYHIMDQFEKAQAVLRFCRHYWMMILGIILIVLMGYRNELKSLLNMALIGAGLFVIPGVSIFKNIWNAFCDRLGGILVTGAILLTTAGLSLDFMTPQQALIIIYTSLVAIFNMSNASKKNQLLSFVPIIIYSAFNSIDFSGMDFSFTKTVHTVFNAESKTSLIADIIPKLDYGCPTVPSTLALAVGVVLYALGNYCDKIGWAVYKDVANACSRNKPLEIPDVNPKMSDYIMHFIGGNTITLILCIGLPGVFDTTSLILALAVTSFSIIAAAFIYQFAFHDEYVREAKSTASVKDRFIESMNVIAGIAPKNVILPTFNKWVRGGIIAMMGLGTCGIMGGWSGMAVAVLSGIYVKDTDDIRMNLGLATGVAIALSGTLPYAIIGGFYIWAKIGFKLNMSTASMRLGETLRMFEPE